MSEHEGLKEFIAQSFDGLRSSVDKLTERVEKTNGRVSQQEIVAAVHADRIETLRREMGEVRLGAKRMAGAPKSEPDERTETVTVERLKWYLACVGGGGTGVLMLLRLLGKL